jgi:RND family efflux transporter MFP subunit
MTFRARKRRPYWYGAAAVVVVGAAATLVALNSGDAGSAPPATVQVKRGSVTSSVAAAGTVAPVSTRQVAFALAGTLATVTVKPGDAVAAGQILATIDPAEAQESVNQAQDSVNAASQSLDEARAAASAAASPTPSAQPTGTAAPRPTTQQPQGRAQTDAIYTAEIALTKAEQNLFKAKQLLAGTTIAAPVAGKVLRVGGKPGDAVTTAAFVDIGVVEKMMVKADFAEADAVTLATGHKATVQLANRKGTDFAATVDQVAVQGTITNRLVRYTVLLSFDAPPADLLIGQSATAQVIIARADEVLYLPQSAVRITGPASGQVRLPDGEVRDVTVGLRGDGSAEINGIAENTVVRLNAR